MRRIFNFCTKLKPTKNEELIKQNQYVYAKDKLKLINDPKFIEKILRIEESKQPKPYVLQSLQFPILLCASSLFFYHLWQAMPFAKIFKHASISEYTKEHPYSIFIAPLTFQNPQQLITYFPFLAYGLFLNGKFMGTKGLILLYALDAILSSTTTYWYEKHKNQTKGIDMMFPKTIGACTTLAYLSSFMAMAPKHLCFKRIPFTVIGGLLIAYEIEELIMEDELNCRVAHLSSILFGICYGLVFKKMYLTKVFTGNALK